MRRTISISMIHLLRLPADMPTVFVCNCDLTAGRVINKLKEKGYRVPEDVSVVGYDNFIYPGICDVEITTYEVDLGKMVQCAVDVLLEKLQMGDVHVPSIHTVEGHMVLKGSVRKI